MTDIKIPDGSVLVLPSNMQATVSLGPDGATLVRLKRKSCQVQFMPLYVAAVAIALAVIAFRELPSLRAEAGYDAATLEAPIPQQAPPPVVVRPQGAVPQTQTQGGAFGLLER